MGKGNAMNKPDWIRRAPPAALAGIENRARILSLVVGPGTGAICSYCNKVIDAKAVQYNVEAYVTTLVRTLHFHRHCHHLWESTQSGDA